MSTPAQQPKPSPWRVDRRWSVVFLSVIGLYCLGRSSNVSDRLSQQQAESMLFRKDAKILDEENVTKTHGNSHQSTAEDTTTRREEAQLPSPAQPMTQESAQEKKEEDEEPSRNGILENHSYILYKATAGLGHRLFFMSNAAHLARLLNFGLWAEWGYCGGIQLYPHLFRGGAMYPHLLQTPPAPPLIPANLTHVKILEANEVRGYGRSYRPLQRNGTCECRTDEGTSGYLFYRELRRRFQKRDIVEAFMDQHHFKERLVIGVHIRAGNGEQGDFANKKREINNHHEFCESLAKLIREFAAQARPNPVTEETMTPLVFVATDTEPMIAILQSKLNRTGDGDLMDVVSMPQFRVTAGGGVFFGQREILLGEGEDHNEKCLEIWEKAWMDMHLLASTDGVIATRWSSFVYTMPFHTLLGRPEQERRFDKPFCSIKLPPDMRRPNFARPITNTTNFTRPVGPPPSSVANQTLLCYESYVEWCCTDHRNEGKIQVQRMERLLGLGSRRHILYTPPPK